MLFEKGYEDSLRETLRFDNGSEIHASHIQVGRNFSVGKNVQIDVRGSFVVGDFSRFGDDVEISAEEVDIGDHFFHHTPGLRIGGGGSHSEYANFFVGDRCVLHNNYINLARGVHIGDDVGICPGVEVLTHGFWNSIVEGFPVAYGEVHIGSGVLVGQRSFLLPGVIIAENVVVGANSTVTKNLARKRAVYAGSPAKFIRTIKEPILSEKKFRLEHVIRGYTNDPNQAFICDTIRVTYPEIFFGKACINVEEKTLVGEEDQQTDDFRDYLRRWGIKIYTERPFGLARI